MKEPVLLLIKKPSTTLIERLRALYDIRLDPAPDIKAAVTSAREGIDLSQLGKLPALRAVIVHGIGLDSVPVDYLIDHKIALGTTPNVLTADVADLAVALMLAVSRRIVLNDNFVRSGRWVSEGMPPLSTSLTGRKVGILGLGKIGAAIARRAQGFEVDIAYTSRNRKSSESWRFEPDMHRLAQWADMLIVAVAGGEATTKLVGPSMLEALGPQGVLINVSRGSVVDETALVTALTSGAIAGAGLDVFADEPNVSAELLDLNNVILQPHQGSATTATRAAMEELVLANLSAHFAGRAMPGRTDPIDAG